MRIVLLILMLGAAPARADVFCDELWFTRNLAFDRAGYCFGSPLGTAIFDNDGCAGTDVEVEPWNADVVKEVFAQEKLQGCQVDTSRTALEIEEIEQRKQFVDIPLPVLGESGCIGWKGANQRLTIAADENSGGVGVVTTGDEILFSFAPRGAYEFVIVRRNNEFRHVGWMKIDSANMECEMYAG